VNICDYILDKFGYERFNFGDVSMSHEMPGINHNLGGYFVMERLDFPTFKKEIEGML